MMEKLQMEDALHAISSMAARSEQAQGKFSQGTSQHSLLENRIRALHIASHLIKQELGGPAASEQYTREELEKAHAPLVSLISKSQKAQEKVKEGSWQHRMLGENLKALYIAVPLLEHTLCQPPE